MGTVDFYIAGKILAMDYDVCRFSGHRYGRLPDGFSSSTKQIQNRCVFHFIKDFEHTTT